MKKVIVFAISFAFASAAFAGNKSSNNLESAMGNMVSESSSQSASRSTGASVSDSMSHSTSVGGASVSKSGEAVALSQSISAYKTVSMSSAQKTAPSVQSGSTRTRCATRLNGNIEERVCQFVTISQDEANAFFDAVAAKDSVSKARK